MQTAALTDRSRLRQSPLLDMQLERALQLDAHAPALSSSAYRDSSSKPQRTTANDAGDNRSYLADVCARVALRDTAARYGGEEFASSAAGGLDGASIVAGRCRRIGAGIAVSRIRRLRASPRFRFTPSRSTLVATRPRALSARIPANCVSSLLFHANAAPRHDSLTMNKKRC